MSVPSVEGSGGDQWQEALILPGHASLLESMVEELAEYLGEDPAVVSDRCAAAQRLVAEEWISSGLAKGSDPKSVEQFYSARRTYLYDLTAFGAQYPNVPELEFLARTAAKARFETYLDFGSGIGSVGIFFARRGLEVTLADISPHLLEYAAWRFRRRGLKVNTIDLRSEKLPENAFQLVTALDVVEHLADPRAVVRSIAASAKRGGLFACNVSPAASQYPQHITSYEDIAWGLRAAGFRQRHVMREVHVFERISTSPAMRPLYAGLGYVWFKIARPPVVRMLEALGIKEKLKKLVRGEGS
jgi:2-polyprenyl-3-methyl-5-hydroxy-6-metoxy-1,4-benzoquinol methylase